MKALVAPPTTKQRLVLELLACDYNVPEVAVRTGISRRAIEGIILRAKDKYGVRYINGLVADAIRHGHINVHLLRKREREW